MAVFSLFSDERVWGSLLLQETLWAKKKQKMIEFLEKENGHLHDFFHSVLSKRDKGIHCKNVI